MSVNWLNMGQEIAAVNDDVGQSATSTNTSKPLSGSFDQVAR